jgi:hydroxymethylbilane synthase
MTANTSPSRSLVIGSRGSALALWQARFIAEKLGHLGISTTIRIIKTTGDHLQTASLVGAGGKGLFTKEIEEALLNRSIDLAVHSLKDLPTENPPGLTLAAIPEREDPRDAMVGRKLKNLPEGATVGTSSNRRGAQLRILRNDLRIEPIRGNVDTRLRKLHEGQFDAILLAVAGLRRLQLEGQIAQLFSADEICPAPGQGALAIQTRDQDEAQQICSRLNHSESNACVTAERMVLSRLGGGCQLPVGVYAQISGDRMTIKAAVVSPDGERHLRASKDAPFADFTRLAETVAENLITRGAAEILEVPAP